MDLDTTAAPEANSVLDPIERSAEIMFGLIMALTFTGTVSVVSSTRNDVVTMLWSALSCNIAWGLIDAAMFVLAQIVTRERKRSLVLRMAGASPLERRRILTGNMPAGIASVLSASDLDRLADPVSAIPVESRRAVPTPGELRGAWRIFLLVFLSTFPVALPFLFMTDVAIALRTSNAIAIALLFLIGTGLGRHMDWRPYWVTGIVVALFGVMLVALTIALGG